MTNQELAALPFGYLSGYDLMQYCPAQLLIKAQEVQPNCLQQGCTTAYGEVIRALLARYAIEDEMSNVSGTRDVLIVKITSILAIRNILGNAAGVSDLLAAHFNWADKNLKDLRSGFISAILPSTIDPTVISNSYLVCNSFSTLG